MLSVALLDRQSALLSWHRNANDGDVLRFFGRRRCQGDPEALSDPEYRSTENGSKSAIAPPTSNRHLGMK